MMLLPILEVTLFLVGFFMMIAYEGFSSAMGLGIMLLLMGSILTVLSGPLKHAREPDVVEYQTTDLYLGAFKNLRSN